MSGNGPNLKINKSVGTEILLGRNQSNGFASPNISPSPALVATNIFQTWRNGSGGWVTNASDTIVP